VEADPSQLDQIVINLAVNARDAMPQGGRLVIETATQEFDEAFARLHRPMTAGRYVMFAVSDNGSGMDKVTVSRIFEPFFTTKETGKGTGLGLATVYGIVKQSGGNIWVYSEPGRGTTFKIYLPCAAHKLGLTTPSEAKAVALPPRRDGTTVLLVEDDDLMRSVTREMLEEHGYGVVEAHDGKSALERLAASPAPIDLTLTDVVMRGMSGPEMVLQLSESRPDMKIVYTSGYTGELLSEHDAMGSGIVLLEKPFTRAALLNTIHAALG
jgi:CheY-like chemotaxis protein